MSDEGTDRPTRAQGREARERLCPVPAGPPARVGRFEVRRSLGGGGFGRVYLAFDPRLNREVAVKVPRCPDPDPRFREQFLREARAAAGIEHANVCPIFEAGDDAGVPYLVMRYVPGGTLADLLRAGPLAPPAAVRIAKKLALALVAAHARGVVHRDLKPANVLYDAANDDVLVTDFGLARFYDGVDRSADGIKGTPGYMSPEQVGDGETPGAVGPLSDVYSLGVVVFELLTGQPLFRGGPLALMLAHARRPPDPPSARAPGLDPRLDALCLKALAKRPEDRYPSAKAFADALGAYLRAAPGPDPAAGCPPAEAEFRRGLSFDHGEEPDYPKAREWYERAAAQGHAGAQHALGRLYEEGLGGPRDPAAAYAWYERAAAQGHPDAQHHLGYRCQHALGVGRDLAAARGWYEKAAAQGHRGATNALAFLYASGLGVERDEALAAELYEQASRLGAADRGSRLGCIYLDDDAAGAAGRPARD